MRPHPRLTAIAALGAAMLTCAVPAAHADTEQLLHPGDSIQNTIDHADPGATITLAAGTYRENLLITKPVTLVGRPGAVLTPAASVAGNVCTDDADSTPPPGQPNNVGICILGAVAPASDGSDIPTLISPVADVAIRGLAIHGFSGQAVLAFGTTRLTLSNADIADSGDVGVFIEQATDTLLEHDVVHRNGSAGIRVADSSGLTIEHTASTENHDGTLILDASGVTVSHDKLTGNCAGLVILDTPDGGPTGNMSIRDNDISSNDRYCPRGDAPSESGVGVGMIGTTRVSLEHNRIADNVPTDDTADFAGAGVMLLDGATTTGGASPTDNTITDNNITGNYPTDVVYDGSGLNNIFTRNRCTTTVPDSCTSR